jgi:hypothetical protein
VLGNRIRQLKGAIKSYAECSETPLLKATSSRIFNTKEIQVFATCGEIGKHLNKYFLLNEGLLRRFTAGKTKPFRLYFFISVKM